MTNKDLKIIDDLLKRTDNLPVIVNLRATPIIKLTEKEKELLLDTYEKLDDILKEVVAFINIKFPNRQDHINAWNEIDFDTKIGNIKINTNNRNHIKKAWNNGLFDLTKLLKNLRKEVLLLLEYTSNMKNKGKRIITWFSIVFGIVASLATIYQVYKQYNP